MTHKHRAQQEQICTAFVIFSPLLENVFSDISVTRFNMRLGLFVGLLFKQTSTLCGNVVLHYYRTSTKWWGLALGFVAAVETILIAYVASTMHSEASQ